VPGPDSSQKETFFWEVSTVRKMERGSGKNEKEGCGYNNRKKTGKDDGLEVGNGPVRLLAVGGGETPD